MIAKPERYREALHLKSAGKTFSVYYGLFVSTHTFWSYAGSKTFSCCVYCRSDKIPFKVVSYGNITMYSSWQLYIYNSVPIFRILEHNFERLSWDIILGLWFVWPFWDKTLFVLFLFYCFSIFLISSFGHGLLCSQIALHWKTILRETR